MNKLSDIEEKILASLHYDAEDCRGYRAIDHIAGRAELEKAIKHLKELGYIEFYRGLMNDEGEVGGSGWCRSREGNRYVDMYDLYNTLGADY